MWKRLNKILYDKNDYHLDTELKQDVEISDKLLQSTIKYQKDLIPRKIKYFFQNDKMFFLRLIVRNFIKLLILLTIVGALVLTTLLIFGVNLNIEKKVTKTPYNEYPIYIPSSGDIKIDSMAISNYKAIFSEESTYIVFYNTNSTKDYNEWKRRLHGIESNGWDNPYEARRTDSQYWGKYQMGKSARESVKMNNMTWEEWKNNPEIQEAAMRMWVDILYKFMKNDIEKYNGKFLNGWSITESGIIAMSHNVGPKSVKRFLRSGGKDVPSDGSGKPATRFLILGNYDLKINK